MTAEFCRVVGLCFVNVRAEYLVLQSLLLIIPERPQQKYKTRRSEEHTSKLQSLRHLVCHLLLEKKKHRGRQAEPFRRRGLNTTADRRRPSSAHGHEDAARVLPHDGRRRLRAAHTRHRRRTTTLR